MLRAHPANLTGHGIEGFKSPIPKLDLSKTVAWLGAVVYVSLMPSRETMSALFKS